MANDLQAAYPPPRFVRDGQIGAVFILEWRTAAMADETAPTADAVETTADATSTTTTTIDPAEHARVVAALKAANAESAARRIKLEKIEQAEAAKVEADKSETQKALDRAMKAETETEAARAELTTERTKNATIAAANTAQFGTDGKQKFRSAELAYKLAKMDNADLSAETVTDALKAIAKQYPEMLDGGAQSTGGASPTKGTRPTIEHTANDLQKRLTGLYGIK